MPDNERAGETSIKRDLGGLEERGGGFVEAVEKSRMPMLITDAQVPGFPIIYANAPSWGCWVSSRARSSGMTTPPSRASTSIRKP